MGQDALVPPSLNHPAWPWYLVESYTATRAYDSAGHPVTKFDVAVWVPSGLLFNFTTLDVVSTGLLGGGQRLASAYGTSGHTTHLRFTVNQP